MPIRNKPGFVPKSARHQPLYYTELFDRVVAVYEHPTTKATLLLEVDADIWNYEDPSRASGELDIQYQEECRHSLGPHYNTLREALEHLDRILDDPDFGKNFAKKPVRREFHGKRWMNPNLYAQAKKFRRKANGKPYRLTEEDRAILARFGHPETDFQQIEKAANKTLFVLDNERAVNAWEALEILGRENFLSGLGRSAFHWTSSREAADGRTVSFDSSNLFKQ